MIAIAFEEGLADRVRQRRAARRHAEMVGQDEVRLQQVVDHRGHERDLTDPPFANPFDQRVDLDRRRDEERSEEHTSELKSVMRNSYAVFCLKKKRNETY